MTWRYAAASIVGTSHVASGIGCQDAHRCEVVTDSLGNRVLAVVVSDGAGSATNSATGSALVSNMVIDHASSWLRGGGTVRSLDNDIVWQWLDNVRQEISKEAAKSNLQVRDYAATFLMAIVDQTNTAFAQIGDGAIVTSDQPGFWEVAFWPQHGNFANETYFVTDELARDNLIFAHTLRPTREIAIFSDGLERVLLNHAERRAHVPAFERMILPLRATDTEGKDVSLSEALARYLASPPVASRADDDLTLAIASNI